MKAVDKFRIQILLENNKRSTHFNIPKKDRYSDISTDWTLVSLSFTEEIFGIKLFYDEIDTSHAEMCFSNITITHSINKINYGNYFTDKFESIPDYRKTVLLIFIFQNDDDLVRECGFLKSDINRLNKEFKNILMEQNEEYLDHTKREEESIIEKILKN